ncbi:hypothetical protein [Jatrophihabitans sp.]|jgi:hypothetical protein|uniref:hypothetical protein n=1 Tax=Jatrophihabitans sp. TaxID=1932789 RepID=UPI002EE1449F
MPRTKPRAAGTAAATLFLAAAGMVWTSGNAAAYGQCLKTIPADHHSVSLTCPTQQAGSQFRVKTYTCTSMYSGCGSTAIYGAWVPWGGTSSVYTSAYVDTSRVSYEAGYPD